eukprot:TRINITY_DN1308_c0_g1_i2.p1 TRINITY_DN1308_c0_g1~~TRINITY_DN1308_c0_g1_i2.p1  ORF type:complete len:278 (-),score=42.85 TRINITY_DN1308_c0_g1_i2:57-890(-)
MEPPVYQQHDPQHGGHNPQHVQQFAMSPINLAPQPVMMVQNPVVVMQDLLQGLLTYPSLLVKQKPKGICMEVVFGCEVKNEYGIYNPHVGGGKILVAKEHSSCSGRFFCGPSRSFEMSVNTMDDQEVIRFVRPFHGRKGGLFCCCMEFCFQVMRVYAGAGCAGNAGASLGYIRENYSACSAVFSVFNDNDDEIYKIIGGPCQIGTYTMGIFDRRIDTDAPVGTISKQWSGAFRELFTDYDNFFITFPVHATAAERALLFGATILLDFLYFEQNKGQG